MCPDRDLLKRHAATHGDAATQSDDPPFKRRRTQTDLNRPRAQKACKPCAEAKARCEGNNPCLRCLQKSIFCEYVPPKVIEATSRARTSTNDEVRKLQTSPSPPITSDNQAIVNEGLPVLVGMAPASSDGNIVVPDPLSQSVFPLSTPSGSGFGQMTIPTNYSCASSSAGQRQDPNLNTDPVNLHEDLISLDFLPLGMNDHTVSFDDLLNDELFMNQGLSFGVEFAFNSPSNIDPLLMSQHRGPQNPLSSAVVNDFEPGTNRSGVVTPGLRNKLNIAASAQAFKESFWRWTPAKDDHGTSEQRHLSFAWDGNIPGLLRGRGAPPAHQRINDPARGAVLAMILRTCEPDIYQHVLSNFPSSEILTQLIHDFLAFQSKAEFPFIHLSTVDVANERSEFLAILIAYGAALSPKPEVRKLGFALQEAQRAALPLEVSDLQNPRNSTDLSSSSATIDSPGILDPSSVLPSSTRWGCGVEIGGRWR